MPYARKLAEEHRGGFGLKKRTERSKEVSRTQIHPYEETTSRDESRDKIDYDHAQLFGLKKRALTKSTSQTADTLPADTLNVASTSKVIQLDPPKETHVNELSSLGDMRRESRGYSQNFASTSSSLYPPSHESLTATTNLDTLASRMLHQPPLDADSSSSRRSSIVTLSPNQYGRSSIGSLAPVHTPLKQVQPERPNYLSSIPSRLYNPTPSLARPDPEVQRWLDEDEALISERSAERQRVCEGPNDVLRHFPVREPEPQPVTPADKLWGEINSEWDRRNRAARLRRREVQGNMHDAQRDDVILEPSGHVKPRWPDALEESSLAGDSTTMHGAGPSNLSSDEAPPLEFTNGPIRSHHIIVLRNIRYGASGRDIRATMNSLGFSPMAIKFTPGLHDQCFVHFVSEGVARAACDEINDKRPRVLGQVITAQPSIPSPQQQQPRLDNPALRGPEEEFHEATTPSSERASSRSAWDEGDGISATRMAEEGRPTNVLFVANVPIEARREEVMALLDQRNLRYKAISLTIPSYKYDYCRAHVTCGSIEDAQAILDSHSRRPFTLGDQNLGMVFSRQGVVDELTRQRESRRYADDVPTKRVFIPSFPSGTNNPDLEDILLSADVRFKSVHVTKRPRQDGTLSSSYAHVTFHTIDDAVAMREWAMSTPWILHGKVMKVVFSREDLERGVGSPTPVEERGRRPWMNYERDEERIPTTSQSARKTGSFGLLSLPSGRWNKDSPPTVTVVNDKPNSVQATRLSLAERVRDKQHFREDISTSASSTRYSAATDPPDQNKSKRDDDEFIPDKTKDDLPSDTLLIPNLPWEATKKDLMKALAQGKISYSGLNLSRREETDLRPAGHWAKVHFESEADAIAARDQVGMRPWRIGNTHLRVVFSHEERRQGGIVWKRPDDCTRRLLFLDLEKDVTLVDIEAALIKAGKKPQKIQMNPHSPGVLGSAWAVYETIFIAKKAVKKIGEVHPDHTLVTVRDQPVRVVHGKMVPKFGLPRSVQPRRSIVIAWKAAKEKPTEGHLREMMKEVLGRDVFKLVVISSKHHYARVVIDDIDVAADFMERTSRMKFKIENNVIEFSWTA